AHDIDHLVIPTRDYLFAPSFYDIDRAVKFIHTNATSGKTTYVHCKAGRGRSTTIVLCYLVEYKHMTPDSALAFVRSRRPRVLLAPSQWKAVQEFKDWRLASTDPPSPSRDAVLITKADLEGYSSPSHSEELAIVSNSARTRPMIAKLSCLFTSLKVSDGCSAMNMKLTEAPAENKFTYCVVMNSNAPSRQYLLLGAVPFPKDVPRLKELGVGGVITLNESYETLVPTSLYSAHDIDHLRKYAIKILERAHIICCNSSQTLIDSASKLGDDGNPVSVQHVCLYMHDHREPHFSAFKRILRSSSGYCVFLGNNLLSWSSKRQPTLSRSSAEAEYRGVANVVAETYWCRIYYAVQEFKDWRLASTAPPSPSGDAVLITKADLEGYSSPSHSGELAIVSNSARTRPMIAKLSCLFTSLKVSDGCSAMNMKLTEAPAENEFTYCVVMKSNAPSRQIANTDPSVIKRQSFVRDCAPVVPALR
nr:putative dual specificity protein phosphatase DSP8 [Tanacetum cinerariifolium]